MSLAWLPLSTFSLVLEYAVCGFTRDLGPERRSLHGRSLKDVALVSKRWYHAVDELVALIRRDTMQLTFKYGSRTEVMAIRRKVQLRGRLVRDLRIRMGRSDGARFVTGVWWWMEDRELPWNVILSLTPGLKRLDLRFMPLDSRHLIDLLEVAAKCCLQVEFLILPKKQNFGVTDNCKAIARLMEALKYAMARWYLKGKCGGLKQLTVPTREKTDTFRNSTKFIEGVIEFCPNVWYLDGYKDTIDELNDVACDEKWMISLETWENFNKSCTHLREFNWILVPFTDPFFQMFGKYVKPNLKILSLTPNMSWGWDNNLSQDELTNHATTIPDHELPANDVVALFNGCPALIELKIRISMEKDEDVLLYAEAFGDKFWETVVSCCPLLQNLCFDDCSTYNEIQPVKTIRSFTDRGLLALAGHLRLTTIKLPAVCCSGDGLFEFLQHLFRMKDFGGGTRTLVLSLAGPTDYNNLPPHPFYVEIVRLLKCLAQTSEEQMGITTCCFKASLIIHNPQGSLVDQRWSYSYVHNELKPILKKICETQLSLDLHIVLCRDDESTFRRIDNLELNWCLGSQQGDVFIEDEFAGSAGSNYYSSDVEDDYNDDVDI
ncbi:hypothetical protein CCR75_006654 [Bremia lactucae]|uniref:F-box domain-containing protein n=1 Tax=Bremia lactucae TaxID=4779 RepID=A0A976FEG7_BRELC|nr:hypothetical protein CCR75_006654 [Bremia lactucae]